MSIKPARLRREEVSAEYKTAYVACRSPPESRRPEIDFAALRQNYRIIDLLRNEGCTSTAVVRVNACEVITMLKESIPRGYRE